MGYVSKKDLIEKVRPLVDHLKQATSELEAVLDQLNDFSRDMDAALSEAEE